MAAGEAGRLERRVERSRWQRAKPAAHLVEAAPPGGREVADGSSEGAVLASPLGSAAGADLDDVAAGITLRGADTDRPALLAVADAEGERSTGHGFVLPDPTHRSTTRILEPNRASVSGSCAPLKRGRFLPIQAQGAPSSLELDLPR